MTDKDVIDAAVVSFLETSGLAIGLGKIPESAVTSAQPNTPYAIVYPMGSPNTATGSFGNPQEDFDYLYQITSVGKTRKEVARTSSRMMALWRSRGNPVDPGEQVRLVRDEGGIVPSGEDLFLCQDTVIVRIGET